MERRQLKISLFILGMLFSAFAGNAEFKNGNEPCANANVRDAENMEKEKMITIKPLRIDSRLQLFVNRKLIDKLDNLELCLHEPQKQPLAKSPLPDDGAAAFSSVIKDGDIYRAWYRMYNPDRTNIPGNTGYPFSMYCYAESSDGQEWSFPKLGLFEVAGTKENNVFLMQPPFAGNFSVFLDTREGIDPKTRFKAIAGAETSTDGYRASIGRKKGFEKMTDEEFGKFGYGKNLAGGLYTFASPDGIHWKRTSEKPVITVKDEKGFDSQNVSFWSEAEKLYVCYFRTWVNPHTGKGGSKHGLRTVSRTSSPDFVNWSKAVPMKPNLPGEHLYTNQTHPYFREPYIYISLPTRYLPDRGSSTDILFMATEAGSTHYDRLFTEAFIRPGLDPEAWGNRSNYAALNVVPTGTDEMSIYHKNRHRYTLRTDGFISVRAGVKEGELMTKPLIFTGDELVLNFSTSAGGYLHVEIQNADGESIPGFTLEDCPLIVGDKIEQEIKWKNSPSLRKLNGKPVRLRFVIKEADLYSFRFRNMKKTIISKDANS